MTMTQSRMHKELEDIEGDNPEQKPTDKRQSERATRWKHQNTGAGAESQQQQTGCS